MLKTKAAGQGVYLMPIDARLMSSARSLLKYGGGRFTVVGKVVRVFDGPHDEHHPAYADSAAREEWMPALKAAPERLICRSATRCARRQREQPGRREPGSMPQEVRERDLGALNSTTEIRGRGAVILPIAIYK